MEKVISRRKFLKNMAMAGGSTAAGLLLAEYLLERGFSGGLSGTAAAAAAPLWKAAASKNKIVVVSDLHFGISDRFAEQVDNRPLFIEFLQRLQNTTDVRELVIAGDFLVVGLGMLASYPIFNDTLSVGHDVYFHPTRLEGIASALLDGQFPPRVNPDALNYKGYATSMMYPDLLMWPFALFRLMGFS